ncbi:unnamed protein product [Brassica napus]|uniref:(rape) hypothetical protein n=1 Tax=Brassica napus TaxID=3708 RepID=A0A816YSW3_BRANA|nr:unnamed protein product [Brassica napus]
MAGLDFVSDLKPFKSMWKIRVKVIRLWKQYTCVLGETMEMVLADSKVSTLLTTYIFDHFETLLMLLIYLAGDMIHATVKKELVSQFVTLISQGESKLMVNFIVTMAAGSYRPTKHPYRIVFLPTTRLRMCDALPSNLTGLDPVKFESIKDGSQNTDYLVDVIGQIVEVSHVEVVSVNGKDTQKLSLELRNQELPKDDMALAIVDPKPLALTNGVSDKDDFFIHTPRKSIADVKASRQGSETFKAIDNSIVSDAPEGSMMLRGCSSQQSDSTSLTPAKKNWGTGYQSG